MLDELIQRHLSEDLAVLYDSFLVEELLTIDFAEALADIMFLRKLQCRDRRIRQVQVLYEQLQKRIVVPLQDGQALIPIYTPGAVILLVDEQGNCYYLQRALYAEASDGRAALCEAVPGASALPSGALSVPLRRDLPLSCAYAGECGKL